MQVHADSVAGRLDARSSLWAFRLDLTLSRLPDTGGRRSLEGPHTKSGASKAHSLVLQVLTTTPNTNSLWTDHIHSHPLKREHKGVQDRVNELMMNSLDVEGEIEALFLRTSSNSEESPVASLEVRSLHRLTAHRPWLRPQEPEDAAEAWALRQLEVGLHRRRAGQAGNRSLRRQGRCAPPKPRCFVKL